MKISPVELGGEIVQDSEKSMAPWIAGGVGVGAVAAAYLIVREKNRQLRDASLLPYCQDIAENLGRHEYAVVGGLPIDAFNHKDSVVDPANRLIEVSENFETKLLRKNGTVRDYDIFVLGKADRDFQSADEETLGELKSKVRQSMAERAEQQGHPTPIVSTFSFDKGSGLFHTATILDGEGKLTLAHGDSDEELPEDALQTWDLVFPDGTSIKILNPWEQYWRSVVRFASGPKAKDLDKLGTMLTKLKSIPGLAEQEHGDLCQTYTEHYQSMMRGNSRNALNAEWNSPDRDWGRVAEVGSLVLARRVLEVGQKSERITQAVQALPNVFDRFVGVK